MIGSLLRPLNDGLQDERLQYNINSARVKIKPYLKVFMRAGRMTTQWVRLDFNQVPAFGRQTTCDLIRKGHFINRIFLVATLPDIATPQASALAAAGGAAVKPNFGWTNGIGHTLAELCQFTISGEVVDTFDSQLLEILDEFYTPLEKVPAVNELIARRDTGFTENSIGTTGQTTVTVPLPFWFSRGDSAAALPVDAIPADQLQVRIKFRGLNGTYYTTSRTEAPQSNPCDPSTDGLSLWSMAESQFYKEDATGTVIEGLNPENPSQTYVPIEGIQMPAAADLQLGDTYLLVEYIYVDKPEANRFRVSDIRVPVTQHYIIEPFDNQSQAYANIPIRVPNPARAMFFMSQRYEASSYNAHFLATRDLTTTINEYDGVTSVWWPNAQGLQSISAPQKFIPAFANRDSEPISALSLVYEGSLARYATTAPSLFRSALVGSIFTKTPWVNRYYYAIPFSPFPGVKPLTLHCGEANMDKLKKIELRLQFSPQRGCLAPMTVNRYITRIYVETYNIFRVYGGRASLLFSY